MDFYYLGESERNEVRLHFPGENVLFLTSDFHIVGLKNKIKQMDK